MFRATPSFQLAMALLVLFIAYVLQVRTLPYISHTIAINVMSEHQRKVLEGDKLHCEIDADMHSRAAYYLRAARESGGSPGGGGSSSRSLSASREAKSTTGLGVLGAFYASRRSAFEKQVLAGRTAILTNKTATFIFDYNTAEAVLLGSAILVNLAGICFDSSRFSGTNLLQPGVQDQYNSLASAIIVILLASIIYWFVVLGFDILLVTAPQSVTECLARMQAAGSGALKGVKRSLASQAAASPKGKKAAPLPGEVDEANVLHTDNNPLMLMRVASPDGSVSAGASVDLVTGQAEPPSAGQWASFQRSYEAMAKEVKSTKQLVARLQEQVAMGGGGGGGGDDNGGAEPAADVPAFARPNKKAFAPTEASGGRSAGDKIKAARR
jgi:hypothetical protein